MKRVRIETKPSYEAIIARGLLKETGAHVAWAAIEARRCAVVYDRELRDLWRDPLLDSLRQKGLEVCAFSITNGERDKTMDTAARLLSFLAEHGFSRDDLVVCLGGPAVLEIGGFAAALYLRGIHHVHVPSTLLAMVDTCVGGEVGVNLPEGENLAGAVHQPLLSLVDVELLNTLPAESLRSGAAECIKYGMIGDAALLSKVADGALETRPEFVIERCLGIKGDLVAKGDRRLLGLGHTVARALEKISGNRISHGEAVAMGMMVMTRAACSLGYCAADTVAALRQALCALGLPTEPDVKLSQLLEAVIADSKRANGGITLVMPERVGRCKLAQMQMGQLKPLLHAGLDAKP